MRTNLLPLLSFTLLLLLVGPFDSCLAYSVIPGWHTPVLSPFALIHMMMSAVFCCVVVCYWLLYRRGQRRSRILFPAHLLLTIPLVLLVMFPSLPPDGDISDAERWLRRRMLLYAVALILFLAGQLWFFIYCIRAVCRAVKNKKLPREQLND